MSLSHQELRRWFLIYNRKYFGNKLPRETDALFAPVEGHHAFIEDTDGAVTLQIDTRYAVDAKLWKLSLLHEMAHYSSGDWKHGVKFHIEIARLFEAGAYKGLL